MAEDLPRATQVLPRGGWVERTAKHVVTLDYDDRFRRRRRYVASDGFAFLLDLEEAVALSDGDGLLLEQGGVVLVRAAPEPLVEIRAASPALLMRLAWHLGNRHLPTEIQPERLLIRDDHVIAAMLQGLGAELRRIDAPFQPEGGAYAGHGHHHHDHDHDHDHGHDHHHHH